MRIQFILEIYVYRRRLQKKNYTLWSIFMDRIDMSQGYVTLLGCRLDYFHYYLNQMTKPLSYNSYILKI